MAGETITVTIFPDKEALTAEVWQLPVEELLEHIEIESAPIKEKLRWLKCAQFGEVRSEHGSLRNNKNVLTITGVEGDYDQEKMSIGEAATRLHNAGVWSILYTSPSHTPEKPRWRVICPLSQPRPPDDRAQLVARINGVLGGVLSRESFTLSQSYYFGYVTNGIGAHQVLQVSGTAIDLLPALDKGAIGKPATKAAPPPGGNGRSTLEQNAAAEASGGGYSETDALLRAIIDGSSLRPSVTALAGRYAAAGWPIEAAWETIRGAMRSNTSRSDYQIREPQELAAVRWVYAREAQKPDSAIGARDPGTNSNRSSSTEAPSIALPWINKSTWSGTPPTREWTVHNRIPARQVALLSGHGATGKSTIGLQLCVCHQLEHMDWLKGIVEPGPAFFIDAEDDADEIWRRAADIGAHYGVDVSTLANLHILSMVGRECVMASVNQRSNQLIPTPFYKQILEAAADLKPKQIVIASLANIYGGNESDRSQVQQFVSLLTAIAIASGGSVLVLSHASLTGLNTKTGLSGSTQWFNSIRAHLWLRPIEGDDKDQQPDTDLRVLEFMKNQYGKPDEKVVLRWQRGLFVPVSSDSTSLEKMARAARADEIFMRLMHSYAAANRPLSNQPNAPKTFPPTCFAGEPECKDAKLTKRDMEDALNRAYRAGKVRVNITGKGTTRERGRVVLTNPTTNPPTEPE